MGRLIDKPYKNLIFGYFFLEIFSIGLFTTGAPLPSENFERREVLEAPDKYIVFWNFNETHVVFETHVKTSGFVGFGLSPNGGMAGSDIVIGGVKNGKPYLEDRFARGNYQPELDFHQDWFLLSGQQAEGFTVLKFARTLRTCDNMDRNITTDTARLIWAFSGSSDLSYHGQTNRGTKSVLLLSKGDRGKQLPSNAYTLDFTINQLHLPGADTSYYCRAFRIPRNLTSKHQIIRVDPIVTPGNEKVVHHILLLACHDQVDDSHHGEQYECKSWSDTPSSNCYTLIAAWAIGAPIFWYPDDVGLALGDGYITFLRIQMHYDNPGMRTDIVDSSGLRLWMTPTPRRYDAGVIQAGMIPDTNLVIPPSQQEFTLRGWCMQNCFETIKTTHPDGINVFAVGLHTHLLGVKVRLRHIRNETELPPLAADENYDFDFQTFINVEPKVKVMSGGEGTHEEMCNAFILYYPRMDFSVCVSVPRPDTIVSAVPGIQAQATGQKPFFSVSSPSQYVGMSKVDILNSVDWNDKSISQHFQQKTLDGNILYSCQTSYGVTQAPQIAKPYIEEMPPCDGKATESSEDTYMRKEVLEKPDNYIVYWSFNDTHITFETHVKTLGFVGFGLSPNGGMADSDIAIGGVKNGKPYLEDRFARGNYPPELDLQQDWFLQSGYQNGSFTILKFVRRLRSCDDMDRNITTDTTRLIWAYSDSPDLSYHGNTHRGTKSVHLLSLGDDDRILPADAYSLDFNMNNIHLSGADTSYYCRAFRIPRNLTSKQHIIRVDPIVTPGNELVVHHVLMMACQEQVNDSHHGQQYECKSWSDTPTSSCYTLLSAWAIGGPIYWYPNDVGLALGDGYFTFLRIQVHYDNPGMRTDIVDSSGLRLWMTPTLRRYDAGVIQAGMIPGTNLVIPPNQQEFTVHGWCMQNCFESARPTHPDGIKIFALALHTHLIGIKVRLRHIRNGTELAPIAADENYDFDFQSFVNVKPNVNVKWTDALLTECVYKSTARRGLTLGGEGTREEMCNAFILYYPRMDFSTCVSAPRPETLVSAIVGNESQAIGVSPYFKVSSTSQYAGMTKEEILNSADWNNKSISQNFQQKTLEGNIFYSCQKSYGFTEAPKITKLYVKKLPPCDGSQRGKSTQTYMRKLILEKPDNYVVYWNYNESHIVFETHVRTTGFVGFGLSPNGGMAGSDMVVGGVKNGKPYLEDRFAHGNYQPELEPQQDWFLQSGYHNGNFTILKFVRRLRSCDDMDRNITMDTTHLIWAYSDSLDLSYHGNAHRGSKCVHLLSLGDDDRRLPADAYSLDFNMNNINLPGADTSYYCRAFRIPRNLTSKQHIIRVDPIVTPGNELVVHHVMVMGCQEQVNDSHHGQQYDCKSWSDTPSSNCYTSLAAWGIGVPIYWFPDDVGLALGDGYFTFLRIEVHYNNPGLRTDIVDSSGLRLWMTPTLRRYDAGIILAGMKSDTNLVIPPNQQEFTLHGWCMQNCFQSIKTTHPDGINVFAVGLHTHLLGVKVRLRHIRNGTELPPLAADENYDFDFQTAINVEPKVKVMSTDAILTECVYKSTSRLGLTMGGLGTHEEMCNAFILYYPRSDLSECTSVPRPDTIVSAVPGIQAQATGQNPFFSVSSPSQYVGMSKVDILNSVDWTNKSISQNFQQKILHGNIFYSCQNSNGITEAPKITKPYVRKLPPCDGSQRGKSTQTYMRKLILEKPDYYVVYWNYNESHIVFETHVRTSGFVGFGLSPNGGMAGSDMVVGGVKNGKPYLEDRYAKGKYTPQLDSHQDWFLMSGQQSEGFTILKFFRKLRTCDIMDRNITSDTVRLIWAYSDSPHLSYHGATHRGSSSTHLLTQNTNKERSLPTNAHYFDLLMDKFQMPGRDTFYICRAFRVPKNITSKQHIIKVEPIIQTGNEKLVHHIVLVACHHAIPDDHHGAEYECDGFGQDQPTGNCTTLNAVWAVGGTAYVYPEDVGLPLGDGHVTFFKMQMHYDNPTLRRDYVDSSGLRLWLTPTLRRYDAGIIEAGLLPTTKTVIPPYQPAFQLHGWCPKECFQKVKETHPDGINLFASFLHTHLLGTQIRLRHLRNGKELPPIAVDENYDFNYQSYVEFVPNVKVLDTDDLLVECQFNSTKRNSITWGGESTREEMCMAFILYYPAMNFSLCSTQPTRESILKSIPDVEITSRGQVSSPSKYTGKSMTDILEEVDWKNATISQYFQDNINKRDMDVLCGIRMSKRRVPAIKRPFVQKEPACDGRKIDYMPAPTESYDHVVDLEPDVYRLYWKFNNDVITFETHVRTRGFVGFGLSPPNVQWPFNGKGLSDMVVGGVTNGESYFKDRYSDGNREPVVDQSQDWTLLSANQSNGFTSLKFSRPIVSCDRLNDVNITQGTSGVLWAYSNPDTDELSEAYPDLVVRGTRSLNLLTPSYTTSMPPDTTSYDFLMGNIVTQDTTVELCQEFPVPTSNKQHIIKVEGIIKPAHQGKIMYMTLFGCKSERGQPIKSSPYLCATETSCQYFLFAWPFGSTNFESLPESVGLPVGDGSYDVIKIMIHYEVRTPRKVFDGSGFRVWMTSSLRQHDAGWLVTGLPVSDQHIVPPQYKSFTSQGHCTQPCMEKILSGTPDGVTVVGSVLHAHYMAKNISLHHYRKDYELPYLADNRNFDTTYQPFYYLKNPVKLMKTDRLMTECVYDSSWRNKGVSLGNDAHGEMCLSYILYYPRLDVTACLSQPSKTSLIDSLKGQGQQSSDFAGKSPAEVADTADWSDSRLRNQFQDASIKGDIEAFYNFYHKVLYYKEVPVPSSKTIYTPREPQCGIKKQDVSPITETTRKPGSGGQRVPISTTLSLLVIMGCLFMLL